MSLLTETEGHLKEQIKQAILVAELAEEKEIPEIILEKPNNPEHGDFAANVAMQLARIAGKAPRKIAEEIVEKIDQDAAKIKEIEIAGPGFINFFMQSDFLGDLVPVILKAGAAYGTSDIGKGKKVQVEFVSVNPTGLLHLGHARGAAYGDVLCNVLAATGHEVDREYYINDAGNQIDHLALSIETRYLEALGLEAEMPEDGYHGEDIVAIAKDIINESGDAWVHKEGEERVAYFKEYGLKYLLENIATDLRNFRVEFDHWFSERSLYEEGQIIDVLADLAIEGYTYEKEGATWLRSTAFSDDKDRVLVKGDGSYTYLTPDIAYHQNKFSRGYDQIINVWGADHHGYVARLRAALLALGYEDERFSVKIIQMVSLLEQGKTLRMSKRSGNAVSLRELMDEVGIDAVRYYFVTRSNDSQLDFDVELARKQSTDNPVYYVQYAHARICTMLEQAEKQGFMEDQTFDPKLLQTEKEVDLLTKLGAYPQVLAEAAKNHAPHQVTQYVFDLAALLHRFYNAEKVLDEDHMDMTKARIALMKAVQITIANALKIIGVSAPEKM